MNGLYHKEVFMPEGLRELVARKFKMAFSNHAKDACRTDRYGIIIPPTTIYPKAEQIIEIEVKNGIVIKAVVRLSHDSTRDLIIAFAPEGETAHVKTLWFNLVSDKHYTLNRSLYKKA